MQENKTSLVRTRDGKNYLVPFSLITLLFFLWGFANSTHGVLNKFFQDALQLKSTDTAWIQAMVYGGYFLMAIPASKIISKFGYKTGALTGLCLFGVGALLFYPASTTLSFTFFLFALFVMGCGMTCLETACNPYATRLGDPETGVQRLNMAQTFNGLGCIGGPAIGLLVYSGDTETAATEDGMFRVALPYICMGLTAFAVALFFSFIKLPDIRDVKLQNVDEADAKSGLIYNKGFLLGALALFMYVGAQTVLNSYFIGYTTSLEGLDISPKTASLLLGFGAMTLFLLGRIICNWVMKFVEAPKILAVFSIGGVVTMFLMAIQILGSSANLAMYMLAFFFESLMFPAVFALSIEGLGKKDTQTASAILIMCIVGGAVVPIVMAWVENVTSMAFSFVVPSVCFLFVLIFALYKVIFLKKANI